MTKAAELRRRVEALIKAMNPAGSLNARLADLTDEQRAAYARWRENCRRWRARPGNPYQRMIEGDEPPPLRSDVQDALGRAPTITTDMTMDQAAEVYARFMRRE